jgi:hypothetical protein
MRWFEQMMTLLNANFRQANAPAEAECGSHPLRQPTGARPTRRRALLPLTVLWTALLLTALLLTVTTVQAQPIAELSAPPSRLAATPDGVVALLGDGSVVRVGEAGVAPIAGGWQGETLLACGGHIFGIDASGRLAAALADLLGPQVSPHSTPLCLPDGSVIALSENADRLLRLTPSLIMSAQRSIEALADSEIVALDGAVALLTAPTTRYPHGVLGDRIEAASVTLIDPDTLADLGSYTVEDPYVIEQRRVLPFASAGRQGIYLTRSSRQNGAGVVALALSDRGLEPLAFGEEIGLGQRWLNLFAARDDRAYSVRTPHIGGPLERYRLEGGVLSVERYQLDVTNHTIGSRNLDLGILLPDVTPGRDLLVLPRRDLRSLRLIACDDGGCRVTAEYPLEGRLAANPVWHHGGSGLELYAGDSLGRLYRFELDLP